MISLEEHLKVLILEPTVILEERYLPGVIQILFTENSVIANKKYTRIYHFFKTSSSK